MSSTHHTIRTSDNLAPWKRFITLDYIGAGSLKDAGLLILRLATLSLFLHGWMKVQGVEGFTKYLNNVPVANLAPDFFSIVVIAGELLLGIALALGFLTRWSGLFLAGMFAFIVLAVNIPTNGIFDNHGGFSFESSLFYFVPGLVLFLTGAGKYSLDYALTRRS